MRGNSTESDRYSRAICLKLAQEALERAERSFKDPGLSQLYIRSADRWMALARAYRDV
jgi:hypothetical protein